ncbi:MAG: ATP-binding cassette domain-containing protein, partial [Bifidobacteriaceae bacterium]|nr:ATP-binding cassette domain-containing protein [Bifidobacteriaceae bacterium]
TYFLNNLNLRDNILLPALKASPKQKSQTLTLVDRLLERFGIAQVADHGITQVSGGQLQRASICRALVNQPAVIFADEPTGALNSAMAKDVMDTFSETHRDGASIVMVTHSAACAARADRVIYLRDGQIVDQFDLGRWCSSLSQQRENQLLNRLSRHGF